MNKILQLLPPPVIALLLILMAAFLSSTVSLKLLHAAQGGTAWLVTGLALTISTILQLRALKTTLLPNGTPTQLVTLGAYLWTRNPIYLGLLTSLVGLALFKGTLPYWLVPPAFFTIMNRFHIPAEEARLKDVFGADYLRYQQKVNRWI